MATFETFVPRIPVIKAVQWTDDPEVVDDLRLWLEENYAEETAGLIEEHGDNVELTPPGPKGWEIEPGTGRLFVKQSEDQFWTNLGDWLVVTETVGFPNEISPMTNTAFNNMYQTPEN